MLHCSLPPRWGTKHWTLLASDARCLAQKPLDRGFVAEGAHDSPEGGRLYWERLHQASAHCQAILAWTAQHFYPEAVPAYSSWRGQTRLSHSSVKLEAPDSWLDCSSSGTQQPYRFLDDAWSQLDQLHTLLTYAQRWPERAARAAAGLQALEMRLGSAKAAIQTWLGAEERDPTVIFLGVGSLDQAAFKRHLLAEMGWEALMFVPSQAGLLAKVCLPHLGTAWAHGGFAGRRLACSI